MNIFNGMINEYWKYLIIYLITVFITGCASNDERGDIDSSHSSVSVSNQDSLNQVEELRELRLLAENGDEKSQYLLAEVLLEGQTIPSDTSQALEWYRAAADEGIGKAHLAIGHILSDDRYSAHDYSMALDNYLSAAEEGSETAMYNLGVMHYEGKGTLENYNSAYKWFYLALSYRAPNSSDRIELLSQRMTLSSIYDAIEKAQQWIDYHDIPFPEGVSGDDLQSIGRDVFETGERDEALRYYRLAVEEANLEAQFQLGQMYSQGRGVPRDVSEAETWYRKAANRGHASAQHRLGQVIGSGSPEGLSWFRRSARQGYGPAYYSIGYSYCVRDSLLLCVFKSPNIAQAKYWFTKAAENGHIPALRTLGNINNPDYLRYTDDGVAFDNMMGAIINHPGEYGRSWDLTSAEQKIMAEKWYNLANTMGDGVEERYRERLTRVLSPSELQRAQELAQQWLDKFGSAFDR